MTKDVRYFACACDDENELNIVVISAGEFENMNEPIIYERDRYGFRKWLQSLSYAGQRTQTKGL